MCAYGDQTSQHTNNVPSQHLPLFRNTSRVIMDAVYYSPVQRILLYSSHLGNGLVCHMVKGEHLWVRLAVHHQGRVGGHVQAHPSLEVRVQVGVGRSDPHKDLDALTAGKEKGVTESNG